MPGYGFAKVSKAEKEKWGKVMDQFFSDKTNAQYVFSLLDIRHPPTADDVAMVNFLHNYAFSFGFIATKADKISRMQVKQKTKELAQRFAVPTDYVIATSSETKQGRDEVLAKLDKIVAVIKNGVQDVEDEEE